MRIQHVSHACLLLETTEMRLATDPWFEGPAFGGQWHVFPKPVDPKVIDQAEVILLSHGHEDHLHEPTLRCFAGNKLAIYPYDWYEGNVPYLRQLGFRRVIEAPSYKPIKLGDATTVTFVKVGPDSIIVIEGDGRVVVNVNDALHSCEPALIARVTAQLKARWPRIDTVLCGFGGASFYPNTIHCDGKDDVEVARVREQLFVHNFCSIVKTLEPAVAVPFAADFVLLAEPQRWINTARFPRECIAGYYDQHFRSGRDQVRIIPLYPGDVLENNRLAARSPYRDQIRNGSLDHLIAEHYASEIQALAARVAIPPADLDDLDTALLARLNKQAKTVPLDRLARIVFTVRLNDVIGPLCLNVSFAGRSARVEHAVAPAPGALFILETSSDLLRSLFSHPWAGDVLVIGYGGEIRVMDSASIHNGLFASSLELLTAYPSSVASLFRNPVRMGRYLVQNPGQALERIRQKLASNRRAGGEPAIPSLIKSPNWLTEPAATLRELCGLPEWPERLASTLPASGSQL